MEEMLSYLSCKYIKAISLAIKTVGSILDLKKYRKELVKEFLSDILLRGKVIAAYINVMNRQKLRDFNAQH